MTLLITAILLVGLAILLTLNVLVGRRIRRSDLTRFQQNMIIAMIWVTPVFGLLLALPDAGREDQASMPPEPPLPNLVGEAAPEVLTVAGLPAFDVRAHLASFDGVPLLNWPALMRWAVPAAGTAADRSAIEAGKRAWLLHLRDACGDHFQLHEFQHAYLLSSMENRVVRATAEYISTTRTRIGHVLGGIARFDEEEKSVLFVADSQDAYYQYILCYYPDDGHFATSGGVFVNAGCAHFVVPLGDLAAIEPIIAHELTHSALAHLELPTWLDEGLAVNTERRLCPLLAAPYGGRELKDKMLAFWGPAEIQQFWSGMSFLRPDDGNPLSYELARIIVEHLARDWPSFSAFVLNAHRDDAGSEAARQHIGVALGALVCALLDRVPDAQWEPDPAAWHPAAAGPEKRDAQSMPDSVTANAAGQAIATRLGGIP